jgi:catechol 2,3-dioxygenase-like lactoylglutathione lyase family enzyme
MTGQREAADERPAGVLQLRLVVEADDYEQAVAFYRDALGLPEVAAFSGGGDAHVTILDAGRATLELANHAQRTMIDEVEVGHPTTSRLRVAFEVRDAGGQTQRLIDAGATLVARPTETPWQSLNSRLDAPGDLHITLFEELGDTEQFVRVDPDADHGPSAGGA